MSCKYFVNGQLVDENQLKEMLNNGLLDNLIKDGKVDISGFKVDDSKLLKQTTTTQRTTRIPVQKLRDILANEIKTRQGYPLNMLSALELNEAGDDFKIPLWANGAYAAKFESLLTALVTNKVVKQKFPGFSGVLGSEEGFRTKPTEIKEGEDLLSYSGITFTGNFDPATGLQPMRYDAKNKKILPAQVIVPFKFRDEQGNIIPIENFYLKNEKGQLILGDNGQKLLDPNKFPEKLLKLFGFRIPTQGRNSMAAVEIVGFVPEVNGDLILAPRDFTRQMGSDFDVDKMYTYMYNHYYDTATGKLHTNFLGDKKKIKTLIDVTKAKLNSIRDEFKVSKETRKLIDNYINGRLDEDADQEAVIQEFLNANVSSALAKELDNTLDRLRVLNRSYKASRQNVILDNHLRVMTSTNSEVINSIIALDSFGDFTALAKEVNEAREKAGLTPAFTTILSDSYQKMKYINATAGKDGVGSFSVDSTFNANVQGKGLVYKNLDKEFDLENATAEDVLAANNVVTSFGNVSSKGDLSNPYTLKSQAILESIKKQGRKPTDKELINLKKKSTIIRYLQSTAVDNEKSQILDKLNLNSNTFDCVRALVQLGFEEKDIVGLLTQEIVWEYVTALKDAQSSLSPYTPDVQNAIFEKLQAKYDPSKKYSTLTIEEREALSSVSGEELMDDIKQGATKKLSLGTVTTDFNLKQLALLEKFQKLSNIGVELKVVQSSINTFTKGVPNTLIETQKKIQQAENLSISNVFNADKLLAEGTFQGEATKNGVYFADAIFSNYFPYQSNGFITIAKELLLHIPRGSEKSVSAQAKLQAELSKEIRSYLFANSSSNLFLGDPSAFRKTLFIDTKRNQSLATIINKILETDLGIHNGFLNKLSTTLNSNGALSRVNFEAASGENFDERDIYAGFAELFTKDTPIGTFLQNGKQVEFTTRKLAQHLVAAGFLEGGNQGAKQYLKYIPMSYLKAIGFGDYLSNEALEYRDIFGGITDERGNPIQKYPSKFMIQYFQNNPEKARSVNAGTDIENVVKDKKKVLSFTINKDQEKFFLDTIVDEQGEVVSTFPKFVSMYESKKTYQLFMYNESAKRYESIPTTNGDYGFVAYNSNIGASNISLEINPNELPVSAPKTKISVVQNPKANQAPVSTPSPKLTSKERVKALLGELYLDDSVSDLNKQLIEIIDSLELPDNFTFKVNNTMAGKGSYQYSNSTLTINAAHKDHSSRNSLATTINHELIHAFTGDVIKRFEAGDNTLTDVQKRLVGNLKGLQEKYITHLKETGREAALQEFEDMYWAWKADQSLPIPKGISEFYGAIKLTEFVTMALTDTGFQQRLKAVVDEDGRSMWDSIKEVLMGIINSLGFNVEPGTALYGAVGNSLELLRNGQNVSASQKISPSISLDFNSAVGNNETMLDINSNGANVGNVVYGISNNIATISATTVNPDYRRQGVAREAYIKLGDSLLRNNIKLQSGDLNEQSTGLWQNLVALGKAVDLGNGTYEYVNKAITPVQPTPQSININASEYTNHSGGAKLSDAAWDIIGREFGVTNHIHYREPGQTTVDSLELQKAGVEATPLSEKVYNEGQSKATIAARQLGRIAKNHQVRSNYIIRNWAQVKYADAVYALGTIIPKGTPINNDRIALIEQVKGGTGYAVQMAINEGKPVYVYDGTKDSWFKWNGTNFQKTTTPILTKNFAGIGSRTLSSQEVINKSLQAVRDVYANTFKPTQPSTTLSEPETTINIYAGTGENAELSNFATRPFIGTVLGGLGGQQFTSVEQAFQYAKGEFYNTYEIEPSSDKTPADLQKVVNDHLENILNAKTGAEAKALGRKNIGIEFEKNMWDAKSSEIMKRFIKESFEQNPDALAKLLATGNATLTHTQDKGKWGKEFPKLLMEVRDELRGTQPSTQPTVQSTAVKEGVQELFESSPELTSIGTPQQYSAYLDSIFPDSQVKDIVYHGTDKVFDSFKTFKDSNVEGVFYTYNKDSAKIFGNILTIVVNSKTPLIEEDSVLYDSISLEAKEKLSKDYDSVITPNEMGVIFEPEQIHILGSKEDIKGFKQFVEGKPAQQSTQTVQNQTQDTYRYYGSPYTIVVENGVGVDVVGYKGKNVDKNKLLAKYNENPNVDPQTGNSFRTVAPIFKEGAVDSKYELFPGVYANQGQTEALDKLNEFLSSDKQSFLLQGKGGTGKTTIIKKIVKEAQSQGKTVLAIAPTHKAKKVLSTSLNDPSIKSTTLAAALAIKLDESTGKFTPDEFARSQGRVPITKATVIVIDESSMVSDKLLEEIKSLVPKNTKIIFMGDKAQLPPVGQEKDSAVFDINNGYTLTEKMRQAATSPIINIGTKVAENVETTGQRVANPITQEDRVNQYDEVSGSSIIWEDNENQALDAFVEDIKAANGNVNYAKVVTFNNQNHSSPQSVKSLNTKIRSKLYGAEANNQQFIPGEILTAYDTFGGEDVLFYNSEDLIVQEATAPKSMPVTINVTSRQQGNRSKTFNFDIVNLTLRTEDNKIVTVPVIAESSKSAYQATLAQLFKTDKQMGYALSNEFANLEYGYAITSHKAQGSTYTNVYVMEDNIMGSSNGGSLKAKSQSLYVAVSRPTTKLVMVSRKNTENKPFVPFDPSLLGDISEYSSPENSFDPDDYNALGDIFNNDESLPEDSPISRDKLEDYSLICGK